MGFKITNRRRVKPSSEIARWPRVQRRSTTMKFKFSQTTSGDERPTTITNRRRQRWPWVEVKDVRRLPTQFDMGLAVVAVRSVLATTMRRQGLD
ncbi:hypothetical protein VIGAN_08198800, partial [Vigna angularis var. angularis]